MARQLAQWVFFTVFLSVTPIVLDVLPALTIGVPLNIVRILGHGVLLPVAVVTVTAGSLLLFLMACAVKLGAMLCFRSSSTAGGSL